MPHSLETKARDLKEMLTYRKITCDNLDKTMKDYGCYSEKHMFKNGALNRGVILYPLKNNSEHYYKIEFKVGDLEILDIKSVEFY